MTDAEAIGKAVQEKKTIEGELKTLRIKADRYAENFYKLGQHLKMNPTGVIFDDQPSIIGTMDAHVLTASWDAEDVKMTVAAIRSKESRLKDLNDLLT
jgi:hypothetical protein